MTKIEITKKNGFITNVKADGHTNYGVEGEDIVCASASSIILTAVMGVIVVAGVDAKVVRKEKEGFLELSIPNNITNAQRNDVNVVLQTMLIGLSDLREGYSDFIEIVLKGE